MDPPGLDRSQHTPETTKGLNQREGHGASQGSTEEMKLPKNGVENEEREGPWEAAEYNLEN